MKRLLGRAVIVAVEIAIVVWAMEIWTKAFAKQSDDDRRRVDLVKGDIDELARRHATTRGLVEEILKGSGFKEVAPGQWARSEHGL